MAYNYDEFNGQSLVFKYNVDNNGNPITVKIENENKQVSTHGTIQLEHVPDEFNRVLMLDDKNKEMVEVFNKDEITPTTYYIDYNNGVAYLDKTQFGKTKIYNYYSRGLQLIGCSRIFDEHDVRGQNVLLTLQEIIDAGKECIRILLNIGDAWQIIQRLERDIAEGRQLILDIEGAIVKARADVDGMLVELEDKKTDCIRQIDEAVQNGMDNIVNVAGNIEIQIPSSAWVLNNGSYEKQITHNLNSEKLHISAINSDTKEAITIGYKVVDKSNVILKSDENINANIILSASYYNPYLYGNGEIAEEVVAARKGETSLDVKIGKIDTAIAEHSASLETIKNNNIIQISKLKGYDKNDISNTINNINFENGKTYILDDGEVTCNSKINVTLPTRTKLYLLGKIKCKNDFVEITFPTSGNEGNEFKIEYVIYEGDISYKNDSSCVILRSGANVNFDLGVIKNFGKGLRIICENSSQWVQYCKFNFKEIDVVKRGIELITYSTESWINENNFYGGGAFGENNVYMQTINNPNALSIINSNRFHDLGVYTDATEIIKIMDKGCQSNAFYDLRLWEQNWISEVPYISDKGIRNYFSSKYTIAFELIELGQESTYNGDILSKRIENHTGSHMLITDQLKKTKEGLLVLNKFNEYSEGVTVGNIRRQYKYVDTIFVGLGEENSLLNLELQEYLTRKGVTFFIRKNGDSRATLNVGLPSGAKITIKGENGLWKCHMSSNNWMEMYKISDGDGLMPS